MLIKDILSEKGKEVFSVQENQSLQEALGILIKNKIGSLIVLNDKKKAVGIISERDIVWRCYKNPKDWPSIKAKDVMSSKLIIGTPQDDIGYAMAMMTQNRIRHLPIFEDKELVGVISIGDVVKEQLQKTEYENHYLKEYLYGP